MKKNLERSIDGTYTRLLRMAFNVSWSELYRNLPKVSEKIRLRRLIRQKNYLDIA